MHKRPARLIFLVTALLVCGAAPARAHAPSALKVLAAARALAHGAAPDDSERARDGLSGPVRRVRTETAKLVTKDGRPAEGPRTLLETATYDMRGAKIDTAYFPSAGGALTGREVYKYDDRGNIVEMTLFQADGSVLSKETYEYEFDAVGNWTKMTTKVAVFENGNLSFEPSEVTYRSIAYYLDAAAMKKLQGAPASVATVVNASATAGPLTPPVPANNVAAKPSPQPVASQQAGTLKAAPAGQNPAGLAPAPSKPASLSTGPKLVAPEMAANAASDYKAAAPVVKDEEAAPPPAAPAPRALLRPVSGGVLNGQAISLPKPDYPETARRMRTTGTVVIEVVIDTNGKVISARATGGPAMLRDVAERAARQARFTPALLSGQPVRVSGTINYNFSL